MLKTRPLKTEQRRDYIFDGQVQPTKEITKYNSKTKGGKFSMANLF